MTQTEDLAATGETAGRRSRFGSLGSIIGLLVVTWAAALASRPLNDNSFFTHLATGRLILAEGQVPSRDPYTFTALGEPWTVQSWLPSIAYAATERVGGAVGLRLLLTGVYVIAALLLWRLARPAESLLIRLSLVAGAMLVATGLWTERPYMVGVIGLALVWLALDGHVPWWVMPPLLWIWGNSHGSFVLAPVLVALVILGGTIDRGPGWRSVPRHERLVAGGVLGGALLAAVGPLGLRALTFPLVAARRGDVFGEVTEWQAPSFRSSSELAFLALAIVTLLIAARSRPGWRLILPMTAFLGSALYAQRNIVLATVVLVAVLARGAPAVGTIRADDRPPLGRPLVLVVGALLLLVMANTALTPTSAVGDYAARALAWVDAARPEQERVATDEVHGNLLEVLDGAEGSVFFDDRFDLFPTEVFEDYLALERSGPRWDEVLDDRRIDVVVWRRSDGLASLLATARQWRIAFSDATWVAAVRR